VRKALKTALKTIIELSRIVLLLPYRENYRYK